MFLADLSNASFSRRMDREGWSVNDDGKLTKNDNILRSQIKASEEFRQGKTPVDNYPYMSDGTIARRKGRFMFIPAKYRNTGRPLPNSKYPKKLQQKLDEKLFQNNTRLMEKKFDSFQSTSPKPQQPNNSTSSTPTSPVKPKPQTKTTTIKTSNKPAKSTRKLLNKYTIGAAGLVGVTGVGYAGYKYATRNKNKNKR